jgi:ABC-type phosphate/phosphonate transport system permease subunit
MDRFAKTVDWASEASITAISPTVWAQVQIFIPGTLPQTLPPEISSWLRRFKL